MVLKYLQERGNYLLKAVLFDMDGVLIDSEPEYFRFQQEFCRGYGVEFTIEEKKHYVGVGSLETWTDIVERYSLPKQPEDIISMEKRIMDDYYQNGKLCIIKPSRSLLKKCSRIGLKTAVATSSRSENALAVIRRLGVERYVDVVSAGDMVENTKPEPDIFLLAAEKLAVDPAECAVIEDSKSGVAAAKAAGMAAVAFKAPGTEQDLSAADIVVDSLSKIDIKILHRLF